MKEVNSPPPSSAQKSKSHLVFFFSNVLFLPFSQHLFLLISGIAAGSTSDVINDVRMKRPMSRTEVGSSASLNVRNIVSSVVDSSRNIIYQF